MSEQSKETNPKDGAASDKLDLSLFPSSAIAYGALAFVEGDQKYGGYNWRRAGVRASVYVAAAQRHLHKWWNGEECDPVSGVPHLANALACLAVLIDATEQKNLNDDRPPAQSTELYERFQRIVHHLRQVFPRAAERNLEHEMRNLLADAAEHTVQSTKSSAGYKQRIAEVLQNAFPGPDHFVAFPPGVQPDPRLIAGYVRLVDAETGKDPSADKITTKVMQAAEQLVQASDAEELICAGVICGAKGCSARCKRTRAEGLVLTWHPGIW